jgi:hypothetical protein
MAKDKDLLRTDCPFRGIKLCQATSGIALAEVFIPLISNPRNQAGKLEKADVQGGSHVNP